MRNSLYFCILLEKFTLKLGQEDSAIWHGDVLLHPDTQKAETGGGWLSGQSGLQNETLKQVHPL